jgi:phospholipid N-methyltransferase
MSMKNEPTTDVLKQIHARSVTRLDSVRLRPDAQTGRGFFFRESLKSLSVTASLFPSSRSLASALLRPIDFDRARIIVELGMGTGAITTEILRRMAPGSVLFAIEVNPAFIAHVRSKIHDSRFVPISGRAERLGSILGKRGVRRADAIVSSLGLTSMAHDQRASIVGQAAEHLGENGVLTQYQYLPASGKSNWVRALGLKRFAEESFLRQYFREVRSERVMWNIPPAKVYTCRP